MKKTLILLLLCFGVDQVMASPVVITDEESLVKLMDSLSVALVKQDKVWLAANLTEECSLIDPAGQTLARNGIIKAFSAAGVYSLSKMETSGMKYTIQDSEATGTGHMKIEGAMSAEEVIDVSGTYLIQTAFKKTDSGWKISWIRVSQ